VFSKLNITLQVERFLFKGGVMSSVPLKPLADYVVAEQDEVRNKTASGLLLPEGATEKPKVATVLVVGPGAIGDDNERVPMQVKAGDKIVYGGYSTNEVKVGDKTYLLIKEENIYAVLGGK
jgi:chaperonin GroES